MTNYPVIHPYARLFAALALPVLAWTSSAQAAGLPNATFSEIVALTTSQTYQSATGTSTFLPESVSLSAAPAPNTTVTGYANTTGGLRPSLQTNASLNRGAYSQSDYSQADARIRYVVRLDGPPGTSAPMTVVTSGWAAASGGASDVTSGYAQITLASGSGSPAPSITITRQAQVYSPNHQLSAAFSETIPFTMYAGVLYTVDLVGVAQTNLGSSTVFVDSAFEFASGFNSAGYQLSFSPNLASAVPELDSAAFWLVGIAGLAAARRRRRGG